MTSAASAKSVSIRAARVWLPMVSSTVVCISSAWFTPTSGFRSWTMRLIAGMSDSGVVRARGRQDRGGSTRGSDTCHQPATSDPGSAAAPASRNRSSPDGHPPPLQRSSRTCVNQFPPAFTCIPIGERAPSIWRVNASFTIAASGAPTLSSLSKSRPAFRLTPIARK